MVFSSSIFLFLFFPCAIVGYYALYKKRSIQNIFLLGISILFYAWGQPQYVALLILSIIGNYFFGLWVNKEKEKPKETKSYLTLVMVVSLVFNLGLLFFFKYLDFAIENVNFLFGRQIELPGIKLPIGISFYTFMAISYVVDVKRGRTEVQKNILNLGLYLSFFPQLLMGPIVKYKAIAAQFTERKESIEMFSEGFCRFVVGFAKKLILADTLAIVANNAFDATSEISVATAWLGMFAYSLQIYFDFSGYADMAIGLGKMFGFKLPENFDYPYISKSVKEYWLRWHMTLGQWFKDYIMLPLTLGSALKFIPFTKKRLKTNTKILFAMLAVWFATGLWHGASWLFIIWGLYYFVLMRAEMHFPSFKNKIINTLFWFTYATFAVKFGQVIFRSDNLGDAGRYFMTMFGLNGSPLYDSKFLLSLIENKWYLIIGSLACFPIGQYLSKRIKIDNRLLSAVYMLSIVVLMLIGIAYMIKGTYSPFIYFNF